MYFCFSFYTYINTAEKYTDKYKKFIWAKFATYCDLLLPECARKGNKYTTHKISMKAHIVQQKTSVTT